MKRRLVANHRPLPSRNGNTSGNNDAAVKQHRAHDLNGSRTTYTSANASPSLNDNNSRTALLSSDDVRTPLHHPQSHHQQHQRQRRQRSSHLHTDSTADYDDVASHSTIDDTTPQTSSESASMAEIPFESRFKTFVKQKKNKTGSVNPTVSTAAVVTGSGATIATKVVDRYDKSLPAAPPDAESEDEESDIKPSTNLLSEHYADALPVRSAAVMNQNGLPHQHGAHFETSRGERLNQRLMSETESGSQNGSSVEDPNNDGRQRSSGEYDAVNGNESIRADLNNNNDRASNGNHRTRDDDDSDESVDDDEEDAEEGVYDLGASNLFLD